MKDVIRIGSGAGYSGDRIEPAIELAKDGQLDYLVFECLAERTIALAQQDMLANKAGGFDPLLEARMRAVLAYLRDAHGKRRFRIITNMGAANPAGAAKKVCQIASSQGIHGIKVAAVMGDDILARILSSAGSMLDNGMTPQSLGDRIVSANAYLGAAEIVNALRDDADVIITGRVADPSLFLAPQVFEFGWQWQDWQMLGTGTLAGHLLECAGQVTGGYFADPGFKDVDDLARLGFPIAEVHADGRMLITKVAGSGGQVTVDTCAEQLLYEVHDPRAYLTPDVTADFSQVRFAQIGDDRVEARGAQGHPKPQTLKVTVAYEDGFIGEGQMSYGGPGALNRARLAKDIVVTRLKITHAQFDELRADLIGVDALFGERLSRSPAEPAEVRLRVAAHCASEVQARKIGNEVETLYTNGPASGGGARKSVRKVMAVASMLWPATDVVPFHTIEVSA